MGSQLRPHIVWFGEEVPALREAAAIVAQAEVLVIVGSSLQVYPAAGLVHATHPGCAIHLVDPQASAIAVPAHVTLWNEAASSGVPKLAASFGQG